MRYYHSKDGETIDSIAWAVYGRQDGGLVEAMIEANPGIGAQGPILEAGRRIAIPDAPAPVIVQGVRLWG